MEQFLSDTFKQEMQQCGSDSFDPFDQMPIGVENPPLPLLLPMHSYDPYSLSEYKSVAYEYCGKRRMSTSSLDDSIAGELFSSFSDSVNSPETALTVSFNSEEKCDHSLDFDDHLHNGMYTMYGADIGNSPSPGMKVPGYVPYNIEDIPGSEIATVWNDHKPVSTYMTVRENFSQLALSRPMFLEDQPSSDGRTIDMAEMRWLHVMPTLTARTISPCITYRTMLPSSPLPMAEDVINIQNNRYFPEASLPVAPTVLRSQRCIDEAIADLLPEDETLETTPQRHGRGRRSRKRPYARGRSGILSGRVTSHLSAISGGSGIVLESVIPQNGFVCTHINCGKRFKRAEHKRRHEKTVHEKDCHVSYKCWVPGCKTPAFTRSDNLKSHLRNTHGKQSSAQRNRYVATQDRTSKFYDPDWIGDLSKDGYPVGKKRRSGCFSGLLAGLAKSLCE